MDERPLLLATVRCILSAHIRDTVTFCRRSEQIGVDAIGMLEQQLLVSSTLCNSSFMQNKDLISMLDG
jgi:hypothetical protein